MSNSPKLRIKLPFQEVGEEICSLEEMESRFNWGNEPFLIAVEGKVISSYEKLKEFVQQDRFKDREFLDLEVRTFLVGG